MHKKQLIIATLLTIMAAIPASLFLAQEPQETRSRASASTTLSYTINGTNAPIETGVGEPIAIDIIVTPGSNLPSLVKLEMQYDPNILQPGTNPFIVNTTAFPTTIEGPVVINGRVLISVSIGSDATKAIQQPTKVGTLNLVTKAPTTGIPSEITFGTRSQVLSLAQSDEATENVLATTSPAYVSVTAPITPTTIASASPTASPTIAPSPSPVASITAQPSVTIGQSPTPTLSPLSTQLSFSVLMHGIGNSGDNANPFGSDLSNKQPLHPAREVTVFIYNDQNQLTLTKTGTVTYATASGSFTGTIDVGNAVTSGEYTIRVKEETHLRRLVGGIQRINVQQNNVMPAVTMVAGDVNGDNSLNILDYNLIVGCYSDLLPAISCTETNKVKTDLNDNGDVNQFDYNLFLREITVQTGN